MDVGHFRKKVARVCSSYENWLNWTVERIVLVNVNYASALQASHIQTCRVLQWPVNVGSSQWPVIVGSKLFFAQGQSYECFSVLFIMTLLGSTQSPVNVGSPVASGRRVMTRVFKGFTNEKTRVLRIQCCDTALKQRTKKPKRCYGYICICWSHFWYHL